MKTYKNIFKATSLLAVMTLGMASCDDWLTVHPQTQIVEENFWEDKNDLEGVRYAAYSKMADQVDKMMIWGDLRSDVYKLVTQEQNEQDRRDNYKNIIQANIDTTMAYYDWSGMYSVIGYCNKVLQHGEEILAKDKQFTVSEWRQMKAEMVTMRALSYFYLVRAFKNIPYTTKVVNSDSDVEYFPQLPVLEVMDNLIADVEGVAGQARNRFLDKADTKGMITNTAIYALLSDMYLWRASILDGRGEKDKAIADYQACILNSEKSIGKLKDQFDEENKGISSFSNDRYCTWAGAPTFDGKSIDFMYANRLKDINRGIVELNAYDEIFNSGSSGTSGNSYESIFELQFSASDQRENGSVNGMYGHYSGTHLVATLTGQDTKKDARYFFSAWGNIYDQKNIIDMFCMKWCNTTISIKSGAGTGNADIVATYRANKYNHWIIYRLSDMLLNNAEARACLLNLGMNEYNGEKNKDICQQILRMVNRRWWYDKEKGGEPVMNVKTAQEDDIDSKANQDSQYIEHVMDTRAIEFIGEGKRWFDLVRFAERNSDSDDSAEGMLKMYNDIFNKINPQNIETKRSRCENLWGLYSPIYYMECKAYRAGGSNITQNPVWNKSKYER